MGFANRKAFQRALPGEVADQAWESFDHGTQRAILKLYRASSPDVLAHAGERLGDVTAPALLLWARDDPYIGEQFGPAYAEALGGEVTLELVDGGHWTWLTRPELVERAGKFLGS
jgi:pimeloyl-ACP methyl ester carboxylesterase